METNGNNIDDLFKDGLGDYSETPPPAVWDRLEKKLDVRTKKPNQYYRWLGYFGMVSLLLLLGVSVGRNIAGNAPYGSKAIASNDALASVSRKTTDGIPSKKDDVLTSPKKYLSQKNESPAANEPNAQNKNEPDKANNNRDDDEITKGAPPGNIAGPDKATHSKNQIANKKKQNKNIASKKSSRTNHRKGEKADESQDESIYNSAASVKNPKKTPNSKDSDDQTGKSKKVEIAVQQPPKKDLPKLSIDNPDKNKDAKKAPHPSFPRFEAGVKAGYETGFSNDAAKKAVVSPYVQYNVSPRLSIMLQPAVKSAYINSRRIGTPNSYYKVNDDGKTTGPDSTIVRISDLGGSGFIDSLWQRTYTYSQSHDSIVKVSSIGGTYIEFELPVLLKYKVTSRFSVYGGVNIIYSKLISVTENTNTYQNIKITGYDTTYGGYFAPAPDHPKIGSVITYNGTPISNYTGPQYPATESSLLRFGYMLGFSYEYSRRWLFDALVQQGAVSPNVQTGYNINSALSSAYLRLTIGYKLTK